MNEAYAHTLRAGPAFISVGMLPKLAPLLIPALSGASIDVAVLIPDLLVSVLVSYLSIRRLVHPLYAVVMLLCLRYLV